MTFQVLENAAFTKMSTRVGLSLINKLVIEKIAKWFYCEIQVSTLKMEAASPSETDDTADNNILHKLQQKAANRECTKLSSVC
jgi:hypothetical protein